MIKALTILCAILLSMPAWATYTFVPTHAKPVGHLQKETQSRWSVDKDPLLDQKPSIRFNPLDKEDTVPPRTLVYFTPGLSFNLTRFFDVMNTSGAIAGTAPNPPTKTNDAKSTVNPSIAVGTHWGWTNFPVRTDIEYASYSKINHDADSVFSLDTCPTCTNLSSTVRTHTVLINFYYDLLRGENQSPYFSIGGGHYRTKLDLQSRYQSTGNTASGEKSQNGFAWEIGIGLRTRMDRNFAFDMGYRFTELGDLRWDLAPANTRRQSLSTERYQDHAFKIGLSYFPFA